MFLFLGSSLNHKKYYKNNECKSTSAFSSEGAFIAVAPTSTRLTIPVKTVHSNVLFARIAAFIVNIHSIELIGFQSLFVSLGAFLLVTAIRRNLADNT